MNQASHSHNQHPPLILASQSPRRQMLLRDAGYQFRVVAPSDDVEKAIQIDSMTPEELVLESAFRKAEFISAKIKSDSSDVDPVILIAADTVAVCNGQILGKPRDVEHAEQMLRMLSGTEHDVLTGVCLWAHPTGIHQSHLEITTLVMDPISEAQLQEILDSGDWAGKAGAFGFQDGLDWLHIKQGLESNVVGLPVERLPEWISELRALE